MFSFFKSPSLWIMLTLGNILLNVAGAPFITFLLLGIGVGIVYNTMDLWLFGRSW